MKLLGAKRANTDAKYKKEYAYGSTGPTTDEAAED
jgi:hypothetical protein